MCWNRSETVQPYYHYKPSDSHLWIFRFPAPTHAAYNSSYPWSRYHSNVPRQHPSTPAINSDTRHTPALDYPYHHPTPILEHHARNNFSSTHSTTDPRYSHPEKTPCRLAHSHDWSPCDPQCNLIAQTQTPSSPYSTTSTSPSQTTTSHKILITDGSCRLLVPSPQGRSSH